jgi:hypothetical protein
MKFKKDSPLVNPETAIEKLLKIANGIEADDAGPGIGRSDNVGPQVGQ